MKSQTTDTEDESKKKTERKKKSEETTNTEDESKKEPVKEAAAVEPKTVAQLKEEGAALALQLQQTTNPETVILITHVAQVRAVYLLTEQYSTRLRCSFQLGNSSRVLMARAIKNEARKMGVPLTVRVR
ncbi:hypothetical protein RND81_06G002700 [Saponaria officinalis]|uniref:Uncharacterized protein n=1 Tax=Saponaria officinalis TaxID=3572 RepID=A0AAW1K626_SAPOF